MEKLKQGQTVYCKEFYKPDLIETVITKVGRKYFELENYPHDKFLIEGMKSLPHIGSVIDVYINPLEYQLECRKNELAAKISKVDFWNLEFETLQQIAMHCGIK